MDDNVRAVMGGPASAIQLAAVKSGKTTVLYEQAPGSAKPAARPSTRSSACSASPTERPGPTSFDLSPDLVTVLPERTRLPRRRSAARTRSRRRRAQRSHPRAPAASSASYHIPPSVFLQAPLHCGIGNRGWRSRRRGRGAARPAALRRVRSRRRRERTARRTRRPRTRRRCRSRRSRAQLEPGLHGLDPRRRFASGILNRPRGAIISPEHGHDR